MIHKSGMIEKNVKKSSPLPDGSIIVFDLDGTLVDSAPDLMATLNRVLVQEGFTMIDGSLIGKLVGHGAIKMLERALHHLDIPLDDTYIRHLHRQFIDDYEKHLTDMTRPFDGVIKTLDHLKSDGWILSVCTNKFEVMSRKLLQQLNLDHYFAAICGSDTFPVRKPDPRHLTATIEQSGGKNTRAIMIGDSITDVNTAKAANIPIIGLSFGYSDGMMATLEPTSLITHYNEMPEAIEIIRRRFA